MDRIEACALGPYEVCLRALPSDYDCKDCDTMFFIIRKQKDHEQPVTASLVYDVTANILKVGSSWRHDDPEMIQLHQPDVPALKDRIVSDILAVPK